MEIIVDLGQNATGKLPQTHVLRMETNLRSQISVARARTTKLGSSTLGMRCLKFADRAWGQPSRSLALALH